MSCAHCGMGATKKGTFMSIETFRNALKHDNSCIVIGGGEPTLHPLFWQIVMEAISNSEEGVWMATNGSQTDISLTLASLAKKGVLGVTLSLDDFHDPIDEKVIKAFVEPVLSYDLDKDRREIRNVSGNLIKAGRCKEGKEGCICEDIIVKPSGDVRLCGCKNSPFIGNVNTGFRIPNNYMGDECYKNQKDFKLSEAMGIVDSYLTFPTECRI